LQRKKKGRYPPAGKEGLNSKNRRGGGGGKRIHVRRGETTFWKRNIAKKKRGKRTGNVRGHDLQALQRGTEKGKKVNVPRRTPCPPGEGGKKGFALEKNKQWECSWRKEACQFQEKKDPPLRGGKTAKGGGKTGPKSACK